MRSQFRNSRIGTCEKNTVTTVIQLLSRETVNKLEYFQSRVGRIVNLIARTSWDGIEILASTMGTIIEFALKIWYEIPGLENKLLRCHKRSDS